VCVLTEKTPPLKTDLKILKIVFQLLKIWPNLSQQKITFLRSFMENIGPVNGSDQQKTGKEFLDDLLSPNNEEELLLEDEEYMLEQLQLQQQNESEFLNANEADKQFSKEATSQFRRDSHAVILNLSKSTLRNIIMLICDEAVGLFFQIFFSS
jgi:hypothetical protein